MSDFEQYGNKYWAVETQAERIYLHADGVEVVAGGALLFFREPRDLKPKLILFSFGPGYWKYFFAASVIDGAAVCAEHWDPLSKLSAGKTWNKAREKISPTLRHKIFKRDGYKCVLCGTRSEDGSRLTVDHATPIAKGGTNSERNLQTLCDPCNAGKGGK